MNARRKCQRCERDQTDAATICHACAREVGKALAGIRDLWPNLTEATAKQTAMGERNEGKPTKKDSQPLPVNLHASAVSTQAQATITGWVRILAEDNNLPLPAHAIPAMCGWLDTNRKAIRRHEAAVDIANELTDTHQRIHRAVDYPDDKTRFPVGPCPETTEDEPCPGEVEATIPRDETKRGWLECHGCGGLWDTTQWARLGVRIDRRRDQIKLQKSYQRKAG